MEERKEIKIKFTTLIIIILILVIIGLVAYIIYNPKNQNVVSNNASNEVIENEIEENTIDNIDENIVETTNKEDDTDEESSTLKGEKLIQFDNRFFEMKDIAKEYRECYKIKNYKDFNYDLDGDGIIDEITIRKGEDKEVQVWDGDKYEYGEIDIFELNGKQFSYSSTAGEIYIVDLNENDKNMEVVIFDHGPSDDPGYIIYSKKGNQMVEIERMSGYPLRTDKKGTLVIGGYYNPEIYFEFYTIKNSKIEQKETDVDELKDIELTAEYIYFSKDFKNLNKFYKEHDEFNENSLKDFNIEKLDKNTTFKILKVETVKNAYDIEDYKIHVELSDGRKGYIFHIQWAG